MELYHVNAAGEPGKCNAHNRPCPFGGPDGKSNHYKTMNEAISAAEKMNGKNNDGKTLHKSGSKHHDEIIRKASEPFTMSPPAHDITMNDVRKKLIDYYGSEDIINNSVNKYTMEFIKDCHDGEIPKSIPDALLDQFGRTSSSDVISGVGVESIVHDLGWYAIPTKHFAASLHNDLGDDAVLLDCMAGRGAFTKAMRDEGVPTIATDDDSWKLSNGIDSMDVMDAIDKYGGDVTHVVLSWPPYDTTIDSEVYDKIKSMKNGPDLIYIGEPKYGCTGSVEFWDKLDKDIDDGSVTIKVNPNYEPLYALHDNCWTIHFNK